MSANHKNRKFDIILLGATGFTGRIISKYLWDNRGDYLIGFAGRNPEKGIELLSELGVDDEGLWLTADVFNENDMDRVAHATTILMNAVGPFAKYGPGVVAACVRQGAHYLDITGEPSFYHSMKELHDAEAQSKNIAIIPACGFDSIPADLGTRAMVELFEEKDKLTVESFLKTNAQFSGGTWTTAILAIERARKNTPKRAKRRPENLRKIPLKIHFNKTIGRWAIPMPILDPHVVKTSAGSLPDVYGPSFAYAQYFTLKNIWQVMKMIVGIGSIFVLTRWSWGRKYLLNKNLPGTGPSEDKRGRSFFQFQFIGSQGGQIEKLTLKAGDPGYNETAKMFSEAAFYLLKRKKRGDLPSGFLTPSQAFGSELLEILQEKGFTVEQSKP